MTQIFVSIRYTLSALKMPIGPQHKNQFTVIRPILLVYFFVFLLSGVVCVVEADTFAVFSKALYSASSEITTFINIATLFSNIANITELIDKFESGIQMRKFF